MKFSLTLALACSLILAATGGFAAKEEIPDGLLYDRVNRALVNDRQIGTRPLEVKVEDGKVTIIGSVANEKHVKRVEKVVKKVNGVKDVDVRVTVRP